MEPRNRFQGMNSASLCSLGGWYDNPIPTRFLATIDCLKIPALYNMLYIQTCKPRKCILAMEWCSWLDVHHRREGDDRSWAVLQNHAGIGRGGGGGGWPPTSYRDADEARSTQLFHSSRGYKRSRCTQVRARLPFPFQSKLCLLAVNRKSTPIASLNVRPVIF
jgi:hypothetical protein